MRPLQNARSAEHDKRQDALECVYRIAYTLITVRCCCCRRRRRRRFVVPTAAAVSNVATIASKERCLCQALLLPCASCIMSDAPRACTCDELIALVDRALLEPTSRALIVVAVASNSAETGLPWCSDCVQAKGAIDEVVRLAAQSRDGQGAASVAVCALPRDEWKSEHGQTNHPLRLHPQLMVGGIPFVACIVEGKVVGRATEEECFNTQDLLERLQLCK